MNTEEKETVKKLFSDVSIVGQHDMRKRACDVIKAYMNDPANKACRETISAILAEVGYLAAIDVTA